MDYRCFAEGTDAEDVMSALAACPTLNMLNTRYVIYNPEQQPLKNPYAFGNAWFVDKLDMVDNADAEIEALNTIDPLRTAVVDKRFQEDLEGFVPQKDSTATIVLEEYRPNRLTYKSKADKEQLAVFSEVYYQPGWKATVDGKEVPTFPCGLDIAWHACSGRRTYDRIRVPSVRLCDGCIRFFLQFVPDLVIAARCDRLVGMEILEKE